MQDRKAKQRALLTELDALADLRETERVLLLDYAAALGEGGPQMLCAELLRLLMEAAEDARNAAQAAGEKSLYAYADPDSDELIILEYPAFLESEDGGSVYLTLEGSDN